jgi:tetratricopeptide (TPR) repeat protein
MIGCNVAETKTHDILQALFFCSRALAAANLSTTDRAAASGVLGSMYYESGEWDEAIIYLSRTLQLVPVEPGALALRGLAYAQSGHNEEALADMNSAMRISSGRSDVRFMRGLYYTRQGQSDLALGDFTEVIRQEPNRMAGYFSRAKLYEDADQYDKAIADLNAAVRLEPTAQTYGARCAVLAYASQLTAALNDCQKALTDAPGDVDALSMRGLIYYSLGQQTKAAEDFERALELNPDTKLAYYGRGILKLKHGDRTGEDDITEAIQLDADFVARLQRLGFKP